MKFKRFAAVIVTAGCLFVGVGCKKPKQNETMAPTQGSGDMKGGDMKGH